MYNVCLYYVGQFIRYRLFIFLTLFGVCITLLHFFYNLNQTSETKLTYKRVGLV